MDKEIAKVIPSSVKSFKMKGVSLYGRAKELKIVEVNGEAVPNFYILTRIEEYHSFLFSSNLKEKGIFKGLESYEYKS